MVDRGSGNQREIDDLMLTRHACYLIAQELALHRVPGTNWAVCIRFAERDAAALDDMGRFGVWINPNARSEVLV